MPRMTRDEFHRYSCHATAVNHAAKTPKYASQIAAAYGVLEILAKHHGYRVNLHINAGGAALHVTDADGHEYSETDDQSAMDCALTMMTGPLVNALREASERNRPREYEPDDFNDHDEGNTHGN